jgi:hypothetical protein
MWLIGFSVVILAIFVYAITREEKEERKTAGPLKSQPITAPPITLIPPTLSSNEMKTSITEDQADVAQRELKALTVEKEILSYALTHLYESESEGKLSESDRERLVAKYGDDMKGLDERIRRSQMITDLHDLEKSQIDWIRSFQEKYGDMTRKIEEIRQEIGILSKSEPGKETAEAPKRGEEKPKERARKPATEPKEEARPPKSKADEKVEEIRAEVLKELERLEQIETEA